MRTFHSGGVAEIDITQGLPRVTELFEKRMPKTQVPSVLLHHWRSGEILEMLTKQKSER
jgi:DNA-directed RNA polymerase beta' subunit